MTHLAVCYSRTQPSREASQALTRARAAVQRTSPLPDRAEHLARQLAETNPAELLIAAGVVVLQDGAGAPGPDG